MRTIVRRRKEATKVRARDTNDRKDPDHLLDHLDVRIAFKLDVERVDNLEDRSPRRANQGRASAHREPQFYVNDLLADMFEELVWGVEQQRKHLTHLLFHDRVVGGYGCGLEVLVKHLAVFLPFVVVVHDDK